MKHLFLSVVFAFFCVTCVPVEEEPIDTGMSDNDTNDVDVVVIVKGNTAWLKVAAGWYHTCAINTDNKLYCWGNNSRGQLGNGLSGSEAFESIPTKVNDDSWIAITTESENTCGITTNGKLYCWGGNASGQLGDGTSGDPCVGYPYDCSDKNVPTKIGEDNWIEIESGLVHTCGIKAGNDLYCWGDNSVGEIGNGTSGVLAKETTPVKVNEDKWAKITAGWDYSCGINVSGTLYCWGSDIYGQLGDGDHGSGTFKVVPEMITGDEAWSEIVSSKGNSNPHTCGLSTKNNLYCWGNNETGQLGDGTNCEGSYSDSCADKYVPTKIGGDSWQKISAGGDHTCGIKSDGKLYCWGNNYSGQLGDGTAGTSEDGYAANKSVPTKIGDDTWIDISAGQDHTCGIKADSKLYCWGRNQRGELGDGTSCISLPYDCADKHSPTLIADPL